MRKYIVPFLLLFTLSFSAASLAKADPTGSDLIESLTPVDVDAGVAEPSIGEMTIEVVEDVAEVRAASTPADKRLAWFALLASLTGFGMMLVKRLRQMTDWGRSWLPYVSLGLSVLSALFLKLQVGLGWPDALLVGAAPVLMTGINQLWVQHQKRKQGVAAKDVP